MASILNVKFLSRQASFEAHQTGITAVDAAIAPLPAGDCSRAPCRGGSGPEGTEGATLSMYSGELEF